MKIRIEGNAHDCYAFIHNLVDNGGCPFANCYSIKCRTLETGFYSHICTDCIYENIEVKKDDN